jgi:hypothetical protein
MGGGSVAAVATAGTALWTLSLTQKQGLKLAKLQAEQEAERLKHETREARYRDRVDAVTIFSEVVEREFWKAGQLRKEHPGPRDSFALPYELLNAVGRVSVLCSHDVVGRAILVYARLLEYMADENEPSSHVQDALLNFREAARAMLLNEPAPTRRFISEASARHADNAAQDPHTSASDDPGEPLSHLATPEEP